MKTNSQPRREYSICPPRLGSAAGASEGKPGKRRGASAPPSSISTAAEAAQAPSGSSVTNTPPARAEQGLEGARGEGAHERRMAQSSAASPSEVRTASSARTPAARSRAWRAMAAESFSASPAGMTASGRSPDIPSAHSAPSGAPPPSTRGEAQPPGELRQRVHGLARQGIHSREHAHEVAALRRAQREAAPGRLERRGARRREGERKAHARSLARREAERDAGRHIRMGERAQRLAIGVRREDAVPVGGEAEPAAGNTLPGYTSQQERAVLRLGRETEPPVRGMGGEVGVPRKHGLKF